LGLLSSHQHKAGLIRLFQMYEILAAAYLKKPKPNYSFELHYFCVKRVQGHFKLFFSFDFFLHYYC